MQRLENLARTPLFALQQARGGRFVPFAGWELPVQFAGVIAEHTAVRTAVGLFDASHMGEFVVWGPQAEAALQWALTQDVARLRPRRAAYTLLCRDDGGIVDDVIVYREAPERFFLCVNASRRRDDLAHLRTQLGGFACQIEDVSAAWALLALQGPRARATIAALLGPAAAAADLPAFGWDDVRLGSHVGGHAVRLCRTGYTGEHGYELFCAPTVAAELFMALEAAGTAHGLQLCGLGARDTLRLEMKYPLYGQDLDLMHSPLQAGLGFAVKWDKGNFLGRAALEKQRREGIDPRWVGFVMRGRGIARPGHRLCKDGRDIGVVTSGTHSPSLGVPIGCAYLPAALSAVGQSFEVIVRDQPVAAQVVATPFYRPKERP